MRVAVTGATGFAGAHALRALSRAGHTPIALVRSADKLAAVEQLHHLEPVEHVIGDVTDDDAVAALLFDAHAVIHTAAVASLGPRHRDAIEQTNVPGTRLVLDAAVRRQLDPIIHVSSTSALHPPPGGCYRNDSPITTAPLGDYARSKAESEQLARAHQDDGAPVVIVWPSGIVGPDDVGLSVSAKGTARILGTGTLPLPTTGGNLMHDVRDLAAALAAMIEPGRGARRYGVFGHFLTWPEMAALIREVSGAQLRTPRIPNWVLHGAGRVGDLVTRLGMEPPLDSTIARYMTGLVPGDDQPTRADLGLEWRPMADTLVDMLQWLVLAGHLDADRAPALPA